MARQATIIVNYCNVSGTVTTIFPDESTNKCLPNGSNYEVTAALQTLTVNVLCPISAITGDLQNTFTSSQISFTIPQNDSPTQRIFTEVVTFVDGTTATIYITQKGYSSKFVQVPISEHYMCNQGNKYYARRQMISYDGVNYIWKEPPVYTNSGVIYSSGDTDCYEGDCEWNDISETYCLSGTLYSVQQKMCDGVYTEEKRLNQVIGECTDPAEGYEYRWVLSTGLTICGENTSGGTGPTPDTGDTPTVVTDKWIENGYTCSGYDKYIEEVHVYSTDGEIFFPEYPPETRLGALVEENSSYCGWEKLSKWEVSGTTCVGVSLRERKIKYYSDDEGATWYISDPLEEEPGAILEEKSRTCGYIPIDELKYYGVYGSDPSNDLEVDYDGNTTLTTGNTKPSGKDITALTRCRIGSGVTSIGDGALSGATSLYDVVMMGDVTSIGASAFASCSSLTSITIPVTVTTIGSNAFKASGLRSVTIPTGVTSIGASAFDNCSGLNGITINATTPPTLGSNVFANTNNCTIYVPYSSLTVYQSAWSEYASRLSGFIPNPNVPSM